VKRQFSVIDTDVHQVIDYGSMPARLPEPWRSRFRAGSRGPGHLGYWNPNGVMRSDTGLEDGTRIENRPENLARHFLDVYGIEYAVLTGGNLHIGLSPDPDYAAAYLSAENDIVAEEWLPVDPRFRASLLISPADPQLAAREIHRRGDHPGFVQVMMASGARIPYGQRFYHPIYEAAVAHGLPVAIHPGSEGVGISGPPTAAGYPTTYFEWHTGLVGSYIAHLISLVTEGVFIKFPTLKFVLVEGGVSWLPPLLWRFDKNWKALRQSTPWLDRPPSEIVREHVLLTSQPIEEPDRPEQLHQILEMFDAGRMLMFATDFPHWDGDTPDFTARFLPAHLRSRVMSETARELYRLPESPHADRRPDADLAPGAAPLGAAAGLA
jgi:predicted TIM-barrel fold metal-dependent hydrolase